MFLIQSSIIHASPRDRGFPPDTLLVQVCLTGVSAGTDLARGHTSGPLPRPGDVHHGAGALGQGVAAVDVYVGHAGGLTRGETRADGKYRGAAATKLSRGSLKKKQVQQ